MKYLVQHWEKKLDGILFFIQRLEEMLFHYSSDIVRAPVHNTHTLLLEYTIVEKDVLAGRVKTYQLEKILDELNNSIESDRILRDKYGGEAVELINSKLSILKSDAVHYLLNKINSTYYMMTVEYIKNHIREANHKDEIEFGLRAWIASTISFGYSPEYVYNYLRSMFGSPVSDPFAAICDFLDRFDFKKHYYRIYFNFYNSLNRYKKIIQKGSGFIFEDDGNFDKLKHDKGFIGYVELENLDSYAAMRRAYGKLNIFIKFYRVITNRKNKLLRSKGLVIDPEGTELYIPIKASGYKLIEIEPKYDLSYLIDGIIRNCQEKKPTYSQLNKIIDLHNTAIEQQDLNDGFVNLWSILEVITLDFNKESKLENVIQGITPILQNDYFSAVFDDITTSILNNLSAKHFQNLVGQITEGDTNQEKIACFVLMPQYEALREEYFRLLEYYPVIRQKIYTLYQLRNSRSAFIGLSNKYAKRVNWHIYRLYRIRNAIVHSGESHRRIQVLGEHLHVYVDSVINEMIVKLSNENTLRSIKDVLVDTNLLLSAKLSRFQKSDAITYQDIEYLLQKYYNRKNEIWE